EGPAVIEAVNEWTMCLGTYSPPREEGWLRPQENFGEAHVSAADGREAQARQRAASRVVAHKLCVKSAFRNLAGERPPRPLHQRRLRVIILDVASTPPHEEGNTPLRHFFNSFTLS